MLKKWWFWGILALVIVGGIGSSLSSNQTINSTEQNEEIADVSDEYIDFDNTVWVPNFVSYANDMHPDNPTLAIIDIADDFTVIYFEDSNGDSYSAEICDGWNYPGKVDPKKFKKGYGIQYLFDNSAPFYGLTLYGYRKDDTEWEPTIFIQLTNADNIFIDPTYKLAK